MPSCNVCEAGNGNCLANGQVYAYELLDEFYKFGRWLVSFGKYKDFARYETLFFDIEMSTDEKTKEPMISYKFKDKLAVTNNVQTNANCEVEWIESIYCDDETVIHEDAAAGSTSIVVDDISKLGGAGKDSSLLITSSTSGNPITGIYIDSVNTATNTITLQAATTVALKAGDKVRRGAYLRQRGCDMDINNPITLGGTHYYSSKFRTISISHEIDGCELNKAFIPGITAQNILDAKLRKGDMEAINELITAVFFDRNIMLPDGRTETMGLFPALARVEDECDLKISYDLSQCCDDEKTTCENAFAQIQAFFNIVFNKTKYSGLFDNVITVAINMKAQETLYNMQQYFQDYGNVGFLDGTNFDVDIDTPRIRYGGKTIEFLYLPVLDRWDYSFMITMPKDYVALYQMQYTLVTPEMKVAGSEINGRIANGYPTLKYVDATIGVAKELGECQKIVGDMKIASVWMGVDKGAYLIIQNFGSCVTDVCQACSLNSSSFLNA